MSLISVQNLTFCYDGAVQPLFENVSFQIDTNWKLGFIGRNGRGKTSFLKLLSGAYTYQGKISANVCFDYFPFSTGGYDRMTIEVLQDALPDLEDWAVCKELSLLEADVEILWRPYETLSRGERTKTLLAALFSRENHFLLIDEPTNHLDMYARTVLGEYLNAKKGFILVSHDRELLDTCVDHVLSINKTNIELQKGNYTSWQQNKAYQDAFELAENEKREREIRHLKQASARTSGWSDTLERTKYGTRNSGLRPDRGFIGHKSAKMMKRAKVAENRMQRSISEKEKLLKNMETSESLRICPARHPSRRIAMFQDVQIRYDEKQICKPVRFTVYAGQRIALVGGNGAGKSSLLKLLMGAEIKYGGVMEKASNLAISYVPQDTSFLKGSLEAYAADTQIDESRFKAILRKLDFSRAQFEKDMADFSEGQKKKVLIAASLCQSAHLYIWDEPLNYIDILSRAQIEELLLAGNPAMLFVEHDHAFVSKVATDIIEIERI